MTTNKRVLIKELKHAKSDSQLERVIKKTAASIPAGVVISNDEPQTPIVGEKMNQNDINRAASTQAQQVASKVFTSKLDEAKEEKNKKLMQEFESLVESIISQDELHLINKWTMPADMVEDWYVEFMQFIKMVAGKYKVQSKDKNLLDIFFKFIKSVLSIGSAVWYEKDGKIDIGTPLDASTIEFNPLSSDYDGEKIIKCQKTGGIWGSGKNFSITNAKLEIKNTSTFECKVKDCVYLEFQENKIGLMVWTMKFLLKLRYFMDIIETNGSNLLIKWKVIINNWSVIPLEAISRRKPRIPFEVSVNDGFDGSGATMNSWSGQGETGKTDGPTHIESCIRVRDYIKEDFFTKFGEYSKNNKDQTHTSDQQNTNANVEPVIYDFETPLQRAVEEINSKFSRDIKLEINYLTEIESQKGDNLGDGSDTEVGQIKEASEKEDA